MRILADNSSAEEPNEFIFILSAKNKKRLVTQVDTLKSYIIKHSYSTKDLKNICYTLQTGREVMESRIGFLVKSMDELLDKLDQFLNEKEYIEGMYQGEGEIDSQRVYQQNGFDEKEFEQKIHSYILEHNDRELLRFWTEGLSIPWEQLYKNQSDWPKIVSLPSYSFENKKYWAPEKSAQEKKYIQKIAKKDTKNIESSTKNVASKRDDEPFRTICLKEEWSILPDKNNVRDVSRDRIVCFLPNVDGQSKKLLSEEYQYIIFVEEGRTYERISKKHYMIDSKNSADYLRCIQSIKEETGTIDEVFYLWKVGNKGNEAHYYYDCVIYLLQSLAKVQLQPKDILLAGPYQDELEHCYAESIIGFGLSTTMILANTKIRTICKKDNQVSTWLETMMFEYKQKELNIWYDDRTRKTLDYQKIELSENKPFMLRENGVYLITGGLGGLGMIFSKMLLEKYHAKLILTGRKSIEDQQDTLVQFMEEQSNILYIQADVCDEAQMRTVVSQGKNYFGYIDGVIHAAGLEGKGSILDNSIDQFKSVARPKIDGTLNLIHILKNETLDFICLFSSTSALLGDFGSCDYSIGNRFLMSIGRYFASNVYVINWSLWKDGGMAVSDRDSCEMYLKSCGQKYVDTETGTKLFEMILNNRQQEATVIIGKESRINSYLSMAQGKSELEPIESRKKSEKQPKERKQPVTRVDLTKEQLENYIIDDLKQITENILGLTKDEQTETTNFADFGYDSITLANFSNDLKEKYSISVTPDKFFSFPTLDRLCGYFITNFSSEMEAFYQSMNDIPKLEEDYEEEELIMESEEQQFSEEIAPSRQQFDERISVVGMSGLFPDANNTEELWSILEEGRDVICEVPRQRIEWYNKQDTKQHDYSMGVLPQIDEFDPLFFEISPAEAVHMVPEQRLLLEQIWNALEDAGYGSQMLKNDKIGVFVGAEDSDYKMIPPEEGNITANNLTMLSARIAYFLDFKGPNITMSTACSSGLMALHQAYSSIRSGECDTAIVAGVSVLSTSCAYDKMETAGMLASDRKCYSFDKRAKGMIPAEAVAVVILKKESKAYQDRNRIYGTIVASGTNYDGRTNGITAPSGEAQKELIQSVYDNFKIDPRNISYIIAHGTSTKLGDPIELNALNDVFRASTDQADICAVGSVKSNIGHALAASGVVSLISLLLAMEKQMIPKQIHAETKCDYINWDHNPLYLAERNQEWKGTPENPRLGAVSAFGMGGTNVHVVVEGVETPSRMSDSKSSELLLISAKTEEALMNKCKDILKKLQSNNEKLNLADISYTLLAGRMHFTHRIAIVASTLDEFVNLLNLALEMQTSNNVNRNQVDRKFKAQASIQEMIFELSEKCAKENDVAEYRKMLGALADFYCKGYELNGELLFENRVVKCVGLPTYPFAHEKYWKKRVETIRMPNNKPAIHKIHCVYSSESWVEEPLGNTIRELQGSLICFVSKANVNAVLSCVYQYTKGSMIFVHQGDSYYKVDEREYVIQRNNLHDYELLFDDIAKSQTKIDGIAYLWACEETVTEVCGEDYIHIIKAINHNNLTALRILMAGTFRTELERNYLESLLGFQRSIRMVMLDLTMQVVMTEEGNTNFNTTISILVNEYFCNNTDIICYQEGLRKKLNVNVVEQMNFEKHRLTNEGCYLITGGLGGIGFIVAKCLLQKYHAKVILVGRQLNATKKERLNELQQISPTVRYYAADVSDFNQMNYAVANAKQEFGRIDGVFHAAGIGGNGNIVTNDLADYRKGLSPKVQGTLVLNEIFRRDSLKFICYFSSTSAVYGDFGSCEYAVGNRFMMSYAQTARSAEKSLVINWPLWKDGGMTMGDNRRTQMYLDTTGQRFLESEEAMKYIEECLDSSYSQVMVLVGDQKRMEAMVQHLNYTKAPVTENRQQYQEIKQNSISIVSSNTTAVVKQNILSHQELKQKVLNDLRGMVNQLLMIAEERIEYEIVITEYGFDSMSLQEFAVILNKYYGIDTTPDVFYANPTLFELEEYLEDHYQSQLMNKYTEVEVEEMTEPMMQEPINEIFVEQREFAQPTFEEEKAYTKDSVAIIGMSGRFPDALDVNELWDIMITSKNVVKEAPLEREIWHKGDKVRKLGCIPGIDEFDPMFFEIPPAEAEDIDPRQRLLLTESWKALENAGYGQKLLENDTIGVFVGAEDNNYQTLVGEDAKLVSNHTAVMSARLSYLLNLDGPNVCINTACSSGLSALHEAVLSIKSDECDTAVVVGVNLLVEPSGYDKMMDAGILSETMTCYPFDRRANGMVPAEAVAVVVLKRSSKAKEEKNPILATIVGSGMNYDGKTNGITAPSGKSQTRLIRSVYERNHINPREISYIIAHGTGTRLGDPIEMNALADSFHTFTNDKEFCAIGSPKANLGHALAASGIVSLIVLVMAMQKEIIPKQINCEEESDYIRWKESPFYITQENRVWSDVGDTPRMGAVSAFGMSGTNVHVVVESYQKTEQKENPKSVLMVLSAKKEQALLQKRIDLANMLEKGGAALRLNDISYTLIEGRKHYAYRCAFVASSIQEIIHKLRSTENENVWTNRVKKNYIPLDKDIENLVELVNRYHREYNQQTEILNEIANQYVNGLIVDGNLLFQYEDAERCVLPNYPFVRDHYWTSHQPLNQNKNARPMLHPLVHENTSGIGSTEYSTKLDGTEQMLVDHVIQGKKVLPGVAYLEMARYAVENATRKVANRNPVTRISNIGWYYPLTVETESVDVQIQIHDSKDQTYNYEIISNTNTQAIVHSQGNIDFIDVTTRETRDIIQLLERSTAVVSGKECYQFYSSLGMEYGTSFQCIQEMNLCKDYIITKLKASDNEKAELGGYVLYPGMLDGGLQSTIGFAYEQGIIDHVDTKIPFALEQITVYESCKEEMWAIATCTRTDEHLSKYNVELCDSTGRVCVQMIGYVARSVNQKDSGRTILFQRKQKLANAFTKSTNLLQVTAIYVGLENNPNDAMILNVPTQNTSIELGSNYEAVATNVFLKVKEVMKNHSEYDQMIQVFVPNDLSGQLYGAISGILRTAHIENPSVFGKVIHVDRTISSSEMLQISEIEKNIPDQDFVIYQGNRRYVEVLEQVVQKEVLEKSDYPWRNQGVYLITGGAGGIGRIFAEEIAKKTNHSVIILTGKSEKTDSIHAFLSKLKQLGAEAIYRSVDVTNLNQVETLVENILGQYHTLHGVIHMAGVICDQFIIKKPLEQFQEILRTKVMGTVNLDWATRNIKLDCMLYFSSITGVLGNMGQADYAAANHFMDNFAYYRNLQVNNHERHGRTMAINWPFWEQGGMQISSETAEQLNQENGFLPLPYEEGIKVVGEAWSKELDSVACIYGEKGRIELAAEALCETAETNDEIKEQVMEEKIENEGLKDVAINYLKDILSKDLKIPVEMIDDDTILEEFGLDSIEIISLTKQMESIFGILPKTLFYEYGSLEELADFFVKKHEPKLKKMMSGSSEVQEEPKREETIKEMPIREILPKQVEEETDIAIIGVSGRFPMAKNVDELWNNLVGGKDCITEIPKDRWNPDLYYNPDKNSKGTYYTKQGGFINGVYEFDPLFFAMAPNDTKMIDPQERLFLQSVYETMEDAGYIRNGQNKKNGSTLGTNVGVYVGVMSMDYPLFGAQEQLLGNPVVTTGYLASVANRVSYAFDFRGPSLAIDTMCSSSLYALHLACQSIQLGESDAAVVGGINLCLHPNKYLLLCEHKFGSARGKCESFGDKGEGYIPGEGVASILIKPLSKAIEDNDHIYGVIKGSAINHGGASRGGFLVPNPDRQADAIDKALKKAKINPRTISYVEAHGTGTSLGDPIEIAGLQKSYGQYTEETQFCKIGSIKSNIGHLEGAAGIAGLIKVLLQIKHKQIVPSIHSEQLNPYIDFDHSPFIVSRLNSVWSRPLINEGGKYVEYPRRAAISAFGAGGSNAHVIIEEYTKVDRNSYHGSQNDYAIVLSAKSKKQLYEMAQNLMNKIKTDMLSEKDLPSIAYTLQTGRELFDYRLGIHVASMAQLLHSLNDYLQGNEQNVFVSHINKNNTQAQKTMEYENYLQECFMKKGLQKLLSIWSEAIQFDWRNLYTDQVPEKISLPTYAFLHDRYVGMERVIPYLTGEKKTSEIESIPVPVAPKAPQQMIQKEPQLKVSQISKPSESNDTNQIFVFQESWRESKDSVEIQGEKVVVCFAKDSELISSMQMETELSQANITTIWVTCGERYEKNSSNNYTITYEQQGDYATCLIDILCDFNKVDAILYMNSMTDQLFITDFRGILYLIQGMKKANYTNTRLILAGTYRDSFERAYVESWIGFERSIAFNNNEIKIVMLEQTNSSYGDSIQLLLQEIYSSKSDSVLYENGIRKEAVVHPISVESTNDSILKQGGTYLITGGMGGLGLLVAHWLGQKYHAKVILTGRRSEEAVYDKLVSLQREGIDVNYLSGDISDMSQASMLVQKAKATYGPIHGVFHVAGIESGISVFDKDIEEYQCVLNPKIKGSIALEQAFKGDNIDFICYFSSSSAIIGDFGFSDYSVANRFLKGYCEHQNQTMNAFRKSVVICWPLWRDGGMGFSNEQASKLYLKTSGQNFLEKEKGIALLEQLLNQKSHQFIVMTGIQDKIYRMLHMEEKVQEIGQEPVESYKQGKGWKSHMKGWTLEQSVLWDLKKLMQDCIGVNFELMDETLNLADFGFDSVSLSNYAQMISKKYEISFSPNLFYNYATLSDLAQYIQTAHLNHIKEFYAEGSTPVVKPITVAQEQRPIQDAPQVETEQKTVTSYKVQPEFNPLKEPIAIVGISGKFPDADDPEQLWDILINGKEVIHTMAKNRNEWDPNTTKDYLLGSVRNIDEFDNEFFEISPREASTMDPRQRLLLEESWKALEDAGCGNESIGHEKVGIFIGAEDGDYHSIKGNDSGLTSNHNAIMAARISYFFNFNGPNMAINTACSSGLVAVHEACQSLRLNECTTALAAGVNLFTTPISYGSMDKTGMISPDRKCYAFDQRANGMVPAEAVAVVVLKRLSDAKRDHNNIYGIIRGSGINYDGRTNGITAPSGKAQAMLLKEVYEKYSIDPSQIEYILTHGTGTRIGDPIEITSLLDAFQGSNAKQGSIALTSNKPNIGHALAASGVVGLISLLMAMKHETIPASINCSKLCDYIDWSTSPFYVNTENRTWKDSSYKNRIAAVNSFGMSGTNAHLVIESYPSENKTVQKKDAGYLLVFSAKTKQALKEKCKDFVTFLDHEGKNMSMEDISYTLIQGRQHFGHRIAVVAVDHESAKTIINQAMEYDKVPNVYKGVVNHNYVPQNKIQNMVKELCHDSMIFSNNPAIVRETLCAIAEFYCIGYQIEPKEMFHDRVVKVVQIPHYPFVHKKFWIQKEENSVVQKEVKQASKQEVKETPKQEVKQVPKLVAQEVKTTTQSNKAIMSFENIVSQLTDTLAKILYIENDAISYDKSFMELGLDSIIGVEWIRIINKEYGLKISSTKIYQYPNVYEFAKYIQELLQEKDETDSSAEVTQNIPQPVNLDVKERQEDSGLVVLTVDFDFAEESKSTFELINLDQADTEEIEELPRMSVETKEDTVPSIPLEEVPEVVEEKEPIAKGKLSFETIAAELADSLATVLYIESGTIGYDRSFTELGLDSILGVEWIRHINEQYHTKISSTKIYQYPTITEFTKYLQTLFIDTVEEDTKEVEDDLNELLKQVYEGDINLDIASDLISDELGEE